MITNQWLSENMMKWIETIMIIDLLELALRKKRQKRVKMDWIYTSAVLLLSWWLHSTGRRKLSKWCKRKIKLKTILMSIRKSIGYSLYLCDIGHFNLFCIIYRVLLHTLMTRFRMVKIWIPQSTFFSWFFTRRAFIVVYCILKLGISIWPPKPLKTAKNVNFLKMELIWHFLTQRWSEW